LMARGNGLGDNPYAEDLLGIRTAITPTTLWYVKTYPRRLSWLGVRDDFRKWLIRAAW